jgi:hypothetical protein
MCCQTCSAIRKGKSQKFVAMSISRGFSNRKTSFLLGFWQVVFAGFPCPTVISSAEDHDQLNQKRGWNPKKPIRFDHTCQSQKRKYPEQAAKRLSAGGLQGVFCDKGIVK